MDINFNNKKIIIRVDFNVPIKNNNITNTLRIDKSIPTIKKCLQDNPKRIIIISHLGRPNGKFDSKLSLKLLLPYLSFKLNQTVVLSNLDNVSSLKDQIILLENIRFHPEEETKDITDKVISFRNKLTNLGDIFINDAFGCCHRSHSSIIGINCPIKIPGYLVKKEIKYLEESFDNGKKPILAIVGGSKVNDKIKLLKNMIKKVDYLIIGGGMAFTFLKYFKLDIGSSLFDNEGYNIIEDIYKSAEMHNTKIILPDDFKIADKFDNEAKTKIINISQGIPEGWMGLDIGPNSCQKFINIIKKCNTTIWNGPMGVFEFDNFKDGSYQIAQQLVESTKSGSITVIGGGDTTACVTKFNLDNQFTHLSTGGGVSLELLEGKLLPGLEFLKN